MAKKEIIFQGITKNNHLTKLKWLLAISNPTDIIISTAFMRETGLSLVEEELSSVSKKVRIFAGIRNGITTAQAVEKCLEIGCNTYLVDTGASTIIFHPKIYLSRNADEARVIIGSANFTVGGLNNNIEASISMHFDLSEKADQELLEDITAQLEEMISEFPDHVIQVENTKLIQSLLDAGRLADETIKVSTKPVGSSKNRDLDTLSRIKLKTQKIPAKTKIVAPKEKVKSAKTALPVDGKTLLWEGSELTERDLNIPKNENTNATGSTLLKKGSSDIDQQTYFREVVFKDLDWKPDTKTEGKELAEADFQLVIKSVDYGIHTLTLSHDTRTDTATYKQKQPMTALRWGEAKALIAKEDLLGRIMSLYKSEMAEDLFVIEIE